MALGTIRGQVILDVKQAIAAYTAARTASVATVTALNRGGAVMVRTGGIMTAAGLAMAAALAYTVKKAADFERQLDFFGAVSNATAQEMEAVRVKALQLGQDTQYSAGQIAEAFIELGKAGVKPRQIVEGIGEAVASLGAAADIPLVAASNIIVSAVQTFGLAAKDATTVADRLAGAANESMVEVQDLGVSLKYAGGVAAAIGIPFQDLNTAIALLGKYGIRGSTAGTSLRQMMVGLVGNSKKATQTMKELGIITKEGANQFFDATGKLKPLPRVMDILNKSMEGLTQEQKIDRLKTMFNVRALPTVLNLMKEGAKGFDTMAAAIEKTKAAEVASARLDNLSGDVEILRGNIETFVITAGGPFQETMRGIVQGLTKVVQWFTSLDKGTQQTILKVILFTAAALTVMGAITLVVGAIMSFASAMITLIQVGGLIFSVIRTVTAAIWAFNVALFANPIGLTVLAILALIAAFVILYKKSETFRKAMQAVGRWIVSAFKAVVAWFKGLPDFFSSLWADIKSKTELVWNAIISFFTDTIPNFFSNAWESIKSIFMTGVNSVIGFFQQLPNRVSAIVSSFISSVIGFFESLPGKIGFIIGFMVGTVVRLFLNLYNSVVLVVTNIVNSVVTFFTQLPSRVWALMQQFWQVIVNAFTQVKSFITVTVPQIVSSVINWFSQLPGRIWAIMKQMAANAVAVLSKLAANVLTKAQQIYQGIVSWVQRLPSAIAGFFSNMLNQAKTKLSMLWEAAKDFASRIYTSIRDKLMAIPEVVSQAIGNAIQAFKNMVSRAFEAAKDFASGLWEGFKSGLGINSPSFIEKQMVQITDVVAEETKNLRGQIRTVQRLGNHLTKVSTMEPSDQAIATQAAASIQGTMSAEYEKFRKLQLDYSELIAASTASKQAGAVLANATATQLQPPVSAPMTNTARIVKGELDLTPSGRAFIRGVAQDTFDENSNFDASLRRMG